MDANHWDVFAFCALLDVFHDVVQHRFLIVRSDSMPACKSVRDLSASLESPAMAHLVRVFLSQAVRLNCRVCPQHLAGERSGLADALLRGRWHEFGLHATAWLDDRGEGPSRDLSSL